MLDKIIFIKSFPGLYRVLAETKGGVIAQSIEDQRKIAVNAHEMQILPLDIQVIWTTDEQRLGVPLSEVFTRMHEHGRPVDRLSSDPTLRAYFTEVMPNHDQKRVYIGDIRKMITWYAILKDRVDFTPKKKEN